MGAEPGSRDLGADDSNSYAHETFALVGKRGIGDIDFDTNNATLWVTNLFDRRIYGIINITGTTKPVTADLLTDAGGTPGFALDPTSTITCNNGELRPFGLEIYENKLYVGAVCTGEYNGATVADLDAHILAMDLSNTGAGFSSVLSFDLDYGREKSNFGDPAPFDTWHRAEQTSSSGFFTPGSGSLPPMISDIEFVADGVMVIGIMSRFGHMVGPENYYPDPGQAYTYLTSKEIMSFGDILRACPTGSSSYVIEGDPACPNNNPRPATEDGLEYAREVPWENSGPGDRGPGGGEYYVGDWGPGDPDQFAEVATGSLAYLPGSDQVLSSAFDPADRLFYSGGIIWLDNNDGSKIDGIPLYQESPTTFGKVNGLGDLQLLCAAAPIEIGNFVWLDADSDGVQDPDETPLEGVIVELLAPNGNAIATATTDSNGHYLFSNNVERTADTTASSIYGLSALTPDTDGFTIRIDTTQAILTTAGYGPSPTGGTASSSAGNDLHDSDGELNGDYAQTSVDTTAIGANEHRYDFGFGSPAAPLVDLELTKTVNNANPRRGETVVYTLTLTNQGPDDATGIVSRDTLPNEVSYVSHNASVGSFDSGTDDWTVANLPGTAPGNTATLEITVTVK